MAGRLPILSSLLLAAAPVMGAGDKFLIQFEMHPYVEVLNHHLDRIGNNEVSGAGIMHTIYSRYVHGRLIEEHLQQAVGHIQVNRDSYAPFFELPIDIIIPSEDVNENDYIRRPKQSLQQHDDAAPEDNEQYEHRSRYERDLKIRKVILSSDISIATTTIPYARSLSSLKTKNWQDGSRALPVSRERQLKCTKLDDVCTSFSSCLKGGEVDTAQLIEACKAHLVFMKSGGNSLRLVAKDLESNLQKAEKPFKKSPEQGRTLSSLLQSEREAGIHKGSILKEHSAAMGLLWIRRSLAFQLELYASLIDQEGPHPRDAAYDAYTKHLSPFHGWALRKLFPATLSQMPDRQEFIATFGGVTLDELNEEVKREVVNKLRSLVEAWDPLIRAWEKDFA
eukprot:scaffold22707_cov198-Skeletonema_menzelii.AAC.1